MSEEKKDFLQTPRGMLDLNGEDYYSYQGFFVKSQEVCEYYAYTPIQTPVL